VGFQPYKKTLAAILERKTIGLVDKGWLLLKSGIPFRNSTGIIFFSGIWNRLKGGISGKTTKKWNFGPFFFRNIPNFFFFQKKIFFFSYNNEIFQKKNFFTE
jgi:hypothetical protein